MPEQSNTGGDRRDAFLLSRKFCLAWTSLAVIWILVSINALLRQRNAAALVDSGGIGLAEISGWDLLALVVPVLVGIQTFFAYLTQLHARARLIANLPAAYPPPFSVPWSDSIAAGVGLAFFRVVVIGATLLTGLMLYRLVESPIYDSNTKPAIELAGRFGSIYRVDLLWHPSYWKGYLYLGDGKGPSFYPVLLPLLYAGLFVWSVVQFLRMARSHRGRLGATGDYLKDE